jgi:Domain of unknown function (DUF4382)
MRNNILPLISKISARTVFLLSAVFLLLYVSSCKKEQSTAQEGKQKVTIRINDNPLKDLTNVWVDIRYVEIKVDTTSGRQNDDDDDDDDDDDGRDCDKYGTWDTLKVTPGVYDMIRFRNGLDTMLATGFVSSGKILKIRITLGDKNEVSKDSGVTRLPLSICNRKPYVYVKIKDKEDTQVVNGEIRIQLDFDIARSISYRNGKYCLQPYIKAYSKEKSGRIEGEVAPREARSMPMAYNATDTGYAKPDEDGEFEIGGLKPGTYNLRFNPENGYKDTVLTGIVVRSGKETELRKIVLQK